jgi:hypothetical protein
LQGYRCRHFEYEDEEFPPEARVIIYNNHVEMERLKTLLRMLGDGETKDITP